MRQPKDPGILRPTAAMREEPVGPSSSSPPGNEEEHWPRVTVVTLSRGRPHLLRRAIDSVRAQTAHVRLTHLVLVDDCAETTTSLARDASLPKNVRVESVPRGPQDATGPGRASVLRNQAVRLAEDDWIAFLDDDNEFTPAHLAELFAVAVRAGVAAVHSYRELCTAEGLPYLEERDPWCADLDVGRRSYRQMVAAGILTPGSNVMRDGISVGGITSVDTSEWLLARSVLMDVPFRETFDSAESRARVTEDDALVADLTRAQIAVETSGLPTVRYYLGGYSTTFGRNAEWNPA